MPRAASPSGASPASPASPVSRWCGRGPRSPPPCSRSPGSSATSTVSGGPRTARGPLPAYLGTPITDHACRKDDEMTSDTRIRAALEEHWRASESGDITAEHAIYADDAILDYPQSGERFRGRAKIAAQRGGHPADRHFTVLRI